MERCYLQSCSSITQFWASTKHQMSRMHFSERIHFSTAQSETGTVFLMTLFIHHSLGNSGTTSYHKLYCIWGTPPVMVKGSRDPSMRSQRHPSLFQSALQFCTCTFCVMHSALPACPQPLVRSLQLVEIWPYSEEEEEEEEEECQTWIYTEHYRS